MPGPRKTLLVDLMTADRNSIEWRLRHPAYSVSPEDFCEQFFSLSVNVVVQNAGPAAENPATTRRIRGAWGRRLARSASPESIGQSAQPCPWSPPCTYSVFFVEHGRDGRSGLPKPYTFLVSRSGNDLCVSLRIFGFANEWIYSAADALVDCLRGDIDWHDLGVHYSKQKKKKPFVPAIHRDMGDTKRSSLLSSSESVGILLNRPLLFSLPDLIDTPEKLHYAIRARADGLARWHDIKINWSETTMPFFSTIDTTELMSTKAVGFSEHSSVMGQMRFENYVSYLPKLLSILGSSGLGPQSVLGFGTW